MVECVWNSCVHILLDYVLILVMQPHKIIMCQGVDTARVHGYVISMYVHVVCSSAFVVCNSVTSTLLLARQERVSTEFFCLGVMTPLRAL